jgi:hypothetical protein
MGGFLSCNFGCTSCPDLVTLGWAVPCPHPQMLLALARDLLADRDPDHAKTAARAGLRRQLGSALGTGDEVVAEPSGEASAAGI